MISVVNKYTHQPTAKDVYIGRGSALGNPFTHLPHATKAKVLVADRETAVNRYREYLNQQIQEGNTEILNELKRIKELSRHGDVNLLCFCAPKACHGDVIKDFIIHQL